MSICTYVIVLTLLVVTASSTGLSETCIVVNGDNVVASVDGTGIMHSTNKGVNWTIYHNSWHSNHSIRSLTRKDGYLFAATPTKGNGVFRSSDNGATWSEFNNGITSDEIKCVTVGGDYIFAGSYIKGVFRSSDNGESWTAVNSGLTFPTVNALKYNDGRLYAATYIGVFRTDDHGNSWVHLDNKSLGQITVRELAVSGTNVFVYQDSFKDSAHRSTNSGANWSVVNTGLEDVYLNSFEFIGEHCYAATSDGVYRFHDATGTWTAVRISGVDKSVQTIAVSGEYLLLGVSGGVLRRRLSDLTATIPQEWSLLLSQDIFSIYPNPLSSAGTLRYMLEQRASISITIYDALGRSVAEPISNETQESGEHELPIKTEMLQSGLYSCRFRAGEIDRVVPMMIVR